MDWSSLLQPIRFNDKISSTGKENIRSPFLRDVDKITFSFYFRTLQDKTQVQPLAKSSYIRTRLTHSLEVATVGRSLGNLVAQTIIDKYKLNNNTSLQYPISISDFGYIVQAAALAHDIGNPPFGHKGEDAISSFYEKFFTILTDLAISHEHTTLVNELSKLNKVNFTKFDGNAQGFRILTNLAKNFPTKEIKKEGLNLTYPVLATFCKYPNVFQNEHYISSKKIGVFKSEESILDKIKNTLKLKTNKDNVIVRHPLTFLLEAADDICYLVADACDALVTNTLPFNEVYESFYNIIFCEDSTAVLSSEYTKNLHSYYKECYKTYKANQQNSILQQEIARKIIESLASEVINVLILSAAKTFLYYEEQILDGTFNSTKDTLLAKLKLSPPTNKKEKVKDISFNTTSLAQHIDDLRKIAEHKIYSAKEKIHKEITGTIAIGHILEEFNNILITLYLKTHLHTSPKYKLTHKLYLQEQLSDKKPLYDNIQIINDFLVKCTDKNIMEIYHTLKGIS